jgi:hypothetical protein
MNITDYSMNLICDSRRDCPQGEARGLPKIREFSSTSNPDTRYALKVRSTVL